MSNDTWSWVEKTLRGRRQGCLLYPVRWACHCYTRREAEILYLLQQLIVLKRSVPVRPRLKTTDRLIFVCLYRLFPS